MSTIKLRLIRIREDGTFGTFGVLLANDVYLMQTLEPPPGLKKFNRIPPDRYLVSPFNSAKHKNCFILSPTPGRTGILIHSGNISSDTRGCILIGLTSTNSGIGESLAAKGKLNGVLANNSATLLIQEVFSHVL